MKIIYIVLVICVLLIIKGIVGLIAAGNRFKTGRHDMSVSGSESVFFGILGIIICGAILFFKKMAELNLL